MRRLTSAIDRQEAFSLPKTLAIDAVVGLRDADLAQLKGKSLGSKIEADARKSVRKATSQVSALNFFQQVTMAWPNTTAILVRTALLAHPAVPDPIGQYKSLLARVIADLASTLHVRLNPGAVVTEGIISDLSFFETYCRVLVTTVSDVANWHIINKDPPGAKPKMGEGADEFLWRWWKRDIATWLPRAPFGVAATRAMAPLLPSGSDKPLVAYDARVAEAAKRVTQSWGLAPWQVTHLLPRLILPRDILVLDQAHRPGESSTVDQFL